MPRNRPYRPPPFTVFPAALYRPSRDSLPSFPRKRESRNA